MTNDGQKPPKFMHKPKPEANIPSWRLKAEADAKREALARAETAEARVKELEAQLADKKESPMNAHAEISDSMQRAIDKYGQATFTNALIDLVLACKADPDLMRRVFSGVPVKDMGESILDWYLKQGGKVIASEGVSVAKN